MFVAMIDVAEGVMTWLTEGYGFNEVGRTTGRGDGVIGVVGGWFEEDEDCSDEDWRSDDCPKRDRCVDEPSGISENRSPGVSRAAMASCVSMRRFLAAVGRSRERQKGIDDEMI